MIDILPPRCRQCRSRRCGDEGHPRLGHNWTTMQPLWMTLGNDGVHALPTYGTWTIKCYCRLLLMNGKCSDRHLISTTCFVTSSVQVKLVTYSIVTSWSQKEQINKKTNFHHGLTSLSMASLSVWHEARQSDNESAGNTLNYTKRQSTLHIHNQPSYWETCPQNTLANHPDMTTVWQNGDTSYITCSNCTRE